MAGVTTRTAAQQHTKSSAATENSLSPAPTYMLQSAERNFEAVQANMAAFREHLSAFPTTAASAPVAAPIAADPDFTPVATPGSATPDVAAQGTNSVATPTVDPLETPRLYGSRQRCHRGK
ncbi:hypothetical protein MMC07_001632 [Pseudocyphellaria aurata]|nr:hypothetical protein [Pseudocyphellaria aurata]